MKDQKEEKTTKKEEDTTLTRHRTQVSKESTLTKVWSPSLFKICSCNTFSTLHTAVHGKNVVVTFYAVYEQTLLFMSTTVPG